MIASTNTFAQSFVQPGVGLSAQPSSRKGNHRRTRSSMPEELTKILHFGTGTDAGNDGQYSH